jgi:quinol monooxygenase YgiN
MADDRFAMQARFVAQPGRAGEFAALLLEGAAALEAEPRCLLYAVFADAGEPDVVWVTEAWTDEQAHRTALEDPATRELIGRALPLLAGPPEARQLDPVGGKGLRLP